MNDVKLGGSSDRENDVVQDAAHDGPQDLEVGRLHNSRGCVLCASACHQTISLGRASRPARVWRHAEGGQGHAGGGDVVGRAQALCVFARSRVYAATYMHRLVPSRSMRRWTSLARMSASTSSVRLTNPAIRSDPTSNLNDLRRKER